jgi:hypothetical protein
MNERFRELAVQAKLGPALMLHYWKTIDALTDSEQKGLEQIEKFAELIVRECAKFLEDNSGYDDANNSWHPEPEDLLNHFGLV